MRKSIGFCLALVALIVSSPSMAQDRGVAKPDLLVREIVQGMPNPHYSRSVNNAPSGLRLRPARTRAFAQD